MPSAEEWRPIPGHPHYMISSKGRVLSWAPRWKSLDATPRILAPGYTTGGYPTVALTRPNAPTSTRYIHHLVAEAFIGPRPDGLEIRHLDGDPANSQVGNLAYGSTSENAYDRVRHGTHGMARKTHCKRGHEFTPDNIIPTGPDGLWRKCRACKNSDMRQRRAAGIEAAA